MATLLTATGIAAVAPLLVYIYPPAGTSKKEQLSVSLKKALSQLGVGEATQFDAPKGSAFVMIDGGSGSDNSPGDPAFSAFAVREAADKVNVFAVNCSHLGCSIAINVDAKRFECPCHGSQFHLDGSVLHGPATAPLSHLKWQPGKSDSEILVDGMTLPGL